MTLLLGTGCPAKSSVTTDRSEDSVGDSDVESGGGDSPLDSETAGDTDSVSDSETGPDTHPEQVLDDEAGAKLVAEAAYDVVEGRISVSGAGDIDGDGTRDVIVGLPGNDRGGEASGAVYLVRGAPSGHLDLSAADATLAGSMAAEEFGFSIAGGGDVNGDGVDDLLVGAPGFSESGHFPLEGQVYLYGGPLSGEVPTSDATATLHGEDVGVDFSSVTETGSVVDLAGDVDGDGFSDLLVGAPGYRGGVGVAYLLPGPVDGPIELGAVAWRLEGPSDGGSHVGANLAGVGDTDGDGLDDILVGTPGFGGIAAVLFSQIGAETPTLDDATATVTSDSQFSGYGVDSAGDVNGDGYADFLVSAWLFLGPVVGPVDIATAPANFQGGPDYFGADFDAAGDVDGDGLGDLVVGSPDSYPAGPGSAYIFLGPLLGDLAPSDAAFHLLGSGDDMAGSAVAGLGDLDGDSLDELIIGGAGDDDGGTDAGAAWVVYAGSFR